MANLKHKGETKVISIRIPVKKESAVRQLVKDFLSPSEESVKAKTVEATKKCCDCVVDPNGLLRRGKIRCIKPKEEHDFSTNPKQK